MTGGCFHRCLSIHMWAGVCPRQDRGTPPGQDEGIPPDRTGGYPRTGEYSLPHRTGNFLKYPIKLKDNLIRGEERPSPWMRHCSVYKKVLLRERKRHTACRVVNTPSVVLTGYPLAGYPPGRVPPSRVSPGWTWPGTPLGVCPMEFWVMLQSIMGYGYPPPKCGQTENITFPILRMRAVKM